VRSPGHQDPDATGEVRVELDVVEALAGGPGDVVPLVRSELEHQSALGHEPGGSGIDEHQ
jgi:hypothetical protein